MSKKLDPSQLPLFGAPPAPKVEPPTVNQPTIRKSRIVVFRCEHYATPWEDSIDDAGRLVWRSQDPPACPASPNGCPGAVQVTT